MGQGAIYASATIIDKGMTSMQIIRLRYQFYLPLTLRYGTGPESLVSLHLWPLEPRTLGDSEFYFQSAH